MANSPPFSDFCRHFHSVYVYHKPAVITVLIRGTIPCWLSISCSILTFNKINDYCILKWKNSGAIFSDPTVLTELGTSLSPVGTLDSVFLLATCYFRSSRVQQAKHLLGHHRESNNAKCDLLYAQCCLQLHEYVSFCDSIICSWLAN